MIATARAKFVSTAKPASSCAQAIFPAFPPPSCAWLPMRPYGAGSVNAGVNLSANVSALSEWWTIYMLFT